MKQNDLSFQYTFKKINENISLKSKIIFSDKEKSTVFYASNNMIISYSLSTSFIVERFRISNNKIRNFYILDNLIFALDNNNEFLRYDMDRKQIEKSINLSKFITIPKDKKLTYFKFSKYLNSFLFMTESFDLIKIDYDLNEESSFVKNLYDTLEEEFRKKFEFNTNNKKIRFMDTDKIGKTLIFSINKNVYVMNLFNSQISIIEFQKPISAGLFLEDIKFVVGDIAGKIHFVSNFFDEKPFISTSHWHSHKVTSLEKDYNNEYLYSGGEEGVIVIWNLRSEIKTFLPRIGSEIMTISFSSQKTNILAITLKENSIRFINLFDSTVINDISGISLNKYTGINDFEQNYNNENFKKVKINKNRYLMIINEDIGKIQLLNLKSGIIISNLNLILKNFVSKTEREKINLRKLKLAEVVKPFSNFFVTYDEIKINENVYGAPIASKNTEFLNSSLKFWKISDFSETNFTLELISLAENPHNNESIKRMISYDSKLITYSDSIFKVWDLTDEERQNCIFMGSYRKEKINSVLFSMDKLDKKMKIFSLHNNKFLVKWDLVQKEIENVYSLGNKFKNESNEEKEKDVTLSSEFTEDSNFSKRILLKGEQCLIVFNIEKNEVEYENNFNDVNDFLKNQNQGKKNKEDSLNYNNKKNSYSFKILNAELYTTQKAVNRDQKELKTQIRLIGKLNNEIFLILNYNVEGKICELENFFYVKRLYLRHIDFTSLKASDDLSLFVINNNLDVLISKRELNNQLLKIKLKRNTVDEENLEKETADIVDNFEFYKYDENKIKKNGMLNNYSFQNESIDINMKIEDNKDNSIITNSDLLKTGLQQLKLKKK